MRGFVSKTLVYVVLYDQSGSSAIPYRKNGWSICGAAKIRLYCTHPSAISDAIDDLRFDWSNAIILKYTVANVTHIKRVHHSFFLRLFLRHWMKYQITIPNNGRVKNTSITLIILDSNEMFENGRKNQTPYVVHRSKNICDSIETNVISVQSFRHVFHDFVKRESIRPMIGAIKKANKNE